MQWAEVIVMHRWTPLALAAALLIPAAPVSAEDPAATPPVPEARVERVVIETAPDGRPQVRTAVLSPREADALEGSAIVAPNIRLHTLGFEGCEGLGTRDASDFAGSNDRFAHMQWALARLNASALWQASRPTRMITVAVVDTGIDYWHPDLAGVPLVDGYNALNGRSGPRVAYDDHGHGTHVAGIIAAGTDNGRGIAGLADGAVRIMPVKVLDSAGSGELAWVLDGVEWALANGADLISLSLGGDAGDDPAVIAAGRAVLGAALTAGVPVIVAAGNDGEDGNAPSFPAHLEEAIAVAATNKRDRVAGFSTRGAYVDLAAPGDQIMSTTSMAYRAPEGDYACWSGTSMATPYVSAAAALLMAEDRSISGIRAVGALLATASDLDPTGPDSRSGFGRIAPRAALARVNDPSFAPFRVLLDLGNPEGVLPKEIVVYSDLPDGATCLLTLRAPDGATVTLPLDRCRGGRSDGAAAFFAGLPEADGDGTLPLQARLEATLPSGERRTERAELRVWTTDRSAPRWAEGIAQRWSTALEPRIALDLPVGDGRGVESISVALVGSAGTGAARPSGLPYVEAAAAPGETLLVEATAHDAAGNASTVRLATTAPDPGDALRWSAGHQSRAHHYALGGTMATTTRDGATLDVTCSGTAIAVYAPRGARYGRFAVSLDGVRVATIDPAGAARSRVFSAPLWSISDLTSADHDLRLTSLDASAHSGGVAVDAIGCRTGALVDPAGFAVAPPWSDEGKSIAFGSRAAAVQALRETALTTLDPASVHGARLRAHDHGMQVSAAKRLAFSDIACRTSRHCLANTSRGTYASSDAGQSWRPVGSGSADDATMDCLAAPRGLCLTSDFWGMEVRRSLDGGQTWRAVDPNHLDMFWDAACAANGLCVATGSIFAVAYHSLDSGLTWTSERRNARAFLDQGAGTACGPTVCYAAGLGALFRTALEDGGAWVSDVSGLDLEDSAMLHCVSDTECTGVGLSGGAYLTRDGVHWTTRRAFGDSGPSNLACWRDGDCVSAGYDRFYRRSGWEGGWSETVRHRPRSFRGWPGAAYADAQTVLVGYGTGLFRSVDGGQTFRQITIWR